MIINPAPPHVVQWCNDHPQCKRCRFAGNQCVAPTGDHLYADWQDRMSALIEQEQKS